MNAVWMRARADFRAGVRALVALAILLGLFGAVAMAAGAGARRTGSAYDRFLAATTPPDAFVLSGTPRTKDFFPPVPLQKVLQLPQVQIGGIVPTLSGELLDRSGHVLASEASLSTSELDRQGVLGKLGRVKLLSGRLPDLRSTNEVAMGYDPALDRLAPVGSTIQLALLRSDVNPAVFFSSV